MYHLNVSDFIYATDLSR